MSGMRVEWDEGKNRDNVRKHKVSFQEAATVFSDERALLLADPDHSDAEDRFILLGLSTRAPIARRVPLLPTGRRMDPHHLSAEGHEVGGHGLRAKVDDMRKQYDFTKATRNPYAARLKRQVTIRLDEPTVDYFKRLAEETGVRYQTLINLYLRDCATSGRKLALTWKPAA